MMKRFVCFSIFFFMVLSLNAGEIYFYVASSMSKPAKEITENYNKDSKGSKVLLVTGGSGQLLNKIIFSKKGDIYIPASRSFYEKAFKMNIVEQSWPLLKQTPVFGLSKNGMQKIGSFDDLYVKDIKIALGNPKTMALGKIFQEISKSMPPTMVNNLLKNQVVTAVNVSQIVNYLKIGVVDAGIVFDSVARVNNLPFVRFPKRYEIEDVATVNLLKFSKNKRDARIFIDYILKNKSVFKRYGFDIGVE